MSLEKAAEYYESYYGRSHALAAATSKVTNGEIHIGKPELKSGEELYIIDSGTRYAIVETDTNVNRLETIRSYCENVRSEWFDVFCAPPNPAKIRVKTRPKSVALEIDELCQQGLNSADPKHWEAALQDILKLVRENNIEEGFGKLVEDLFR